jgi:hypothetical protein
MAQKKFTTTTKDVFRPDYDLEAAIKEAIKTLQKNRIIIKENTLEATKIKSQITTISVMKNSSMSRLTKKQQLHSKNTRNKATTVTYRPQEQCFTTMGTRSPAERQKP